MKRHLYQTASLLTLIFTFTTGIAQEKINGEFNSDKSSLTVDGRLYWLEEPGILREQPKGWDVKTTYDIVAGKGFDGFSGQISTFGFNTLPEDRVKRLYQIAMELAKARPDASTSTLILEKFSQPRNKWDTAPKQAEPPADVKKDLKASDTLIVDNRTYYFDGLGVIAEDIGDNYRVRYFDLFSKTHFRQQYDAIIGFEQLPKESIDRINKIALDLANKLGPENKFAKAYLDFLAKNEKKTTPSPEQTQQTAAVTPPPAPAPQP